jgi:molybdopterin-guanine dinucleotide biosynthesis protein
MVPVIAFSGNSGSGKTTLLGKVAGILKSRGYRVAVIRQTRDFEMLLGGDYNLVLTEGLKKAGAGITIEAHRRDQDAGGLPATGNELLAAVADERPDVNVPQFAKDDDKGIADLIEKWLKEQPEVTELTVNGAPVPLNRFVKDFVTKTVLGMTDSMSGFGEVKDLRLIIRRKS